MSTETHKKSIISVLSFYEDNKISEEVVEFLEKKGYRVKMESLEPIEDNICNRLTALVYGEIQDSKKNEKYPNGYLQIGQSNEMFGKVDYVINALKQIAIKRPELLNEILNFNKSIEKLNEIGVEVDISIRYDTKTLK